MAAQQQLLQQQQNEAFGEDGENNLNGTTNAPLGALTKQQQIMPVSQPLFPSSILSIVPSIIELFDDFQIDKNGASGYLFLSNNNNNFF